MQLVKLLCVGMTMFLLFWFLFNKKPQIWENIRNRIEKIEDWKIKLSLFVFVFLSEGWMIFLRKLPISNDEVYSISGASFFAGYNWSEYMQFKKFYNFGYTMLMAPLYKIFEDPITIYRGMLLCNVLLHAITLMIVYHIIRKYFQCEKAISIAISIISTCNAFVLFFKGFIYNEMPLMLVVWLILLFLLELSQVKGRKRIILSALLGVIAAYAYIIHSRCIIIYVTMFILVVLFLIIYRKLLIEPISFTVLFGSFYYLEKNLIDYVQRELYLIGTDVVIQNSVKHVMTGTWRYRALTSLEGIADFIARIFTLSGALTIEMGGLFTIVTVIALYYFVKRFTKWRKGEEAFSTFIVFLFSFVSLFGMIAAIALTGASNGKMRFIAYSRYFMPFIGPFILYGLVILKKYHKMNLKWFVIWTAILTIIVGCVYLFYALPILDGESLKVVTSYYYFMAFTRYPLQMTYSKNVLCISFCLLVLFTGILLYLYKRKQMIALCSVSMIFAVSLVAVVEQKQCYPSSQMRYTICDKTYKIIENEKVLRNKDVFCLGNPVYQKGVLVSAYDHHLIYDVDRIKKNQVTVIFSSNIEDMDFYQPPYVYMLDQSECIGFWDENLCRYFEKQYQRYISK